MMNDQLKMNAKESSASVECLGMTFSDDHERRLHFLAILADKLKDPAFREQEGFPEGSDEAILALSNPPYYTACPNPWLSEFIKTVGKQFSEDDDDYSISSFSLDVVEGKNDPLYAVPSYHTKVPPKAIEKYIEHYTKPGEIVLDAFCGTGMTGVAALNCGRSSAGRSASSESARNVILIDLSPAAAFVASFMAAPLAEILDEGESGSLGKFISEEVLPLYEVQGKNGQTFDYAIFSEWGECDDCGHQFLLYDHIIDHSVPAIKSEYDCPSCGTLIKSRAAKRAFSTEYDPWIKSQTRSAKTSMVLLSRRVGQQAVRLVPSEADVSFYNEIGERSVHLIPQPLNYSHMTHERNNLPEYWGITHIHHFFSKRNYVALDKIAAISEDEMRRSALFCALTILENNGTRRNRFYVDKRRPNGSPIGPLSNTLYVPSLQTETNIGRKVNQTLKSIEKVRHLWPRDNAFVSTQSATSFPLVPDNSIDFIFTDPPFGGNINYSEQNILYEWWLQVFTNNKCEAITNNVQQKGIAEYAKLMELAFKEYYRVLKPGRYIVVEFHNSANSVWNAIQFALEKSGFIVSNVALLDKIQTTLHQDHKAAAVNKDLAITAYKPKPGVEAELLSVGTETQGIWSFVSEHLKCVPVTKSVGGELAFVSERDPRVLFDRAVAWFVRHGVLVPLSHQEFLAEVNSRFSIRDGMVFLPGQIDEYDRRRARDAQAPQIELFVSDERSAIDWIADFLRRRPSTYQEIHPEFTSQLGAGWKKHEERPELVELLEENFLRFDGSNDVPSQIHSYLSSNFKDLRGLEKDAQRLKAKAKDRWYVPDPSKARDLEQKRERSLLKEFESYKSAPGRRLKEFRLEVLRTGFKTAWAGKDYKTIIGIAQKIPDEALQEDEKLLLWYDQALTRMEADA
jgi:DNA modification methylase